MDTGDFPDHAQVQVDPSKWNAPETSLRVDLVQLANATRFLVDCEAEVVVAYARVIARKQVATTHDVGEG